MLCVYGSPLYQWDKNRQLKIDSIDPTTNFTIHCCHKDDLQALIVEPILKEDGIFVNIPNILLQESDIIRVYVVVEEDTIYDTSFFVKARPKPDDYIYEETEILSVQTLVDRGVEEAKKYGDKNLNDHSSGSFAHTKAFEAHNNDKNAHSGIVNDHNKSAEAHSEMMNAHKKDKTAHRDMLGTNNTILADDGVAVGSNNKITTKALRAFVGGTYNTADAPDTFIFGDSCKSNHSAAVLLGYFLQSARFRQLVCGEFNALAPNALFVVGNGENKDNRSNAFEIIYRGGISYLKLGDTEMSEEQLTNVLNIPNEVETVLDSIIAIQESLIGGAK